jgi:GNAT superfamily N-acetyltransferase
MPSAPIHLRPASDTDSPALAELFLETRRETFGGGDPAQFQLTDFAEQTAGETIHLAADASGCLLGFISVWLPDQFVHHLFVSRCHQRQGVGTLLLRSLESWFPLPYRLKCLCTNASALAFYRNLGWQKESLGSDALGDYWVLRYDGPAADSPFPGSPSI